MKVRRPLLLPLVPLYRFGLARKNRRFEDRSGCPRRLRFPVISVGSISAGGAGKTPFLIALAGMLRRMGYEPDVLSRGYGRRDQGVKRVDPDESALESGDEPLMLARELGCPVFVGADRFAAGMLAEGAKALSPRTVHLLDDGFGHRRLARTVDIALLTEEDVHDSLLPGGNLREPITSLGRAQVIVLREDEAAGLRHVLEVTFATLAKPEIWTVRRTLVLPPGVPSRPLAFCGVARPAGFEAALRMSGVAFLACRRFRDHHRYTLRDASALVRQARNIGANGFVTTAKDAVKLEAALRGVLEKVGPVAVADVSVTMVEERACADVLEDLLRRKGDRGADRAGWTHA